MAGSAVQDRVRKRLGELTASAIGLSRSIHAHPELAFAEHWTMRETAEFMENAGFTVARAAGGIATAMTADHGSGDFRVGIVGEFDALPEIGHACGHNVITGAAALAACALRDVVDDLGISLRFLGAPAEEYGAGKVAMIEAGLFDNLDVAMMVHPTPYSTAACHVLAIGDVDVTFTGKPAHASWAPYEGLNAADAMTVAQVAIGLMRQQLHPGEQVHGIVTHGGEVANVIPGHTRASYNIRARTGEGLASLRERVSNCFRAGALATGCDVEFADVPPDYTDFNNNEILVRTYQRRAEELGHTFPAPGEPVEPKASTDMANVSKVLPSLHPMMRIECGDAVNHQFEFAAYCGGPAGDKVVVDGGTAMALTVVDLATTRADRLTLIETAAAMRRTT